MTAFIIPRAYRCTVELTNTLNGEKLASVFHVGRDGDFQPPPEAGIAQDLFNNYRDHFLPLMTSNIRLDLVVVKNIGVEDGPVGQHVPAANTIGANSVAAAMTPNVAYLIKWSTGLSGRARRGRTFLPGVGEDRVDGAGLLLATTLTGLTNAAQAFKDGMTDGGQPPGAPNYWLAVASFYKGTDAQGRPIPREDPFVTKVTVGAADPKVATQRGRLR